MLALDAPPAVFSAVRKTSWSSSRYGRGFSSAPLMIENTDVVAPMPTASDTMAISANPGCRRSWRDAKRKSEIMGQWNAGGGRARPGRDQNPAKRERVTEKWGIPAKILCTDVGANAW